MALRKIIKQDEFRELGFGNKVVESNQRLMNKDGSSNVRRKGLPFFQSVSIYQTLITMPWWKFNLLVFTFYITVNILFALVYYFVDPDHINGMVYNSEFEKFAEVFFFSAQSLTTVGYGRLNPSGYFDSTLASIESLIGLLGFALATGLLYGRFSRPLARILFSKNMVVAPYKGITALMFRVANRTKSELVDIQASVILSYVIQENGKPIRKFSNLKLELTKVNLLSTSWTIVHPIDEESPLYNWKEADFKKNDLEVLALLQAYEETFSQTVHTRTSYTNEELHYGAKFESVIEAGPNGSITIALDKIDKFVRVDLEQEIIRTA
ncbi:MAG: Inward rectifier potassium channel Irk [Bacteroidetes bacterium]|nr:Inward rectifier potassium channel Irk [Bacteroidota bacterium]MBL0258672.1 Inward rectifier potassium channel Irk [Bacteroidota bacterium]